MISYPSRYPPIGSRWESYEFPGEYIIVLQPQSGDGLIYYANAGSRYTWLVNSIPRKEFYEDYSPCLQAVENSSSKTASPSPLPFYSRLLKLLREKLGPPSPR